MARPALTTEEVTSRRTEILDVAEHLFETQGLEAVSLRRIATQAGISPATPYRYFPTKDDVLRGLQVRGYDALRLAIEEAADGELRATDKLRAIARTYIQFALERSATYALLFRTQGNEASEPELLAAKIAALGVCRQAFTQAVADGELNLRTDPLTAAHLFWAAAHGVVSLHLGEQLVMGRSLDDLVPILIATVTTGLTLNEETP